jgi:hypothetical protein
MCGERSAVRPSECENVIKKSRVSITLENNMEVFRRIEDGQTRPNVCKGIKFPPVYSEYRNSFRSPSIFYLLVHSRCRGFVYHLITLRHTPQSVGLLWTRDRPVAETST